MTFNEDIIERATHNTHFREVLSTGPHSQVVVMMIPGGGEIGEETHEDVDQILVFTAGEGEAILERRAQPRRFRPARPCAGRDPPQHRERRAG